LNGQDETSDFVSRLTAVKPDRLRLRRFNLIGTRLISVREGLQSITQINVLLPISQASYSGSILAVMGRNFVSRSWSCVVRWAAAHAAELGADPTRIAVAGDSAGANMAAVAALRLRDEGGPALCGQLLLYPVTDYYTPGTPSYRENAEGYGLTLETMKWFWVHYLNGPSEGAHPHAAPLRAPVLSGLPPALVITAEYDPLRDEGELYVERLRQAGVSALLSRYDGVNHGFMFWAGVVDKAGAAMTEACEWLRRVFAGRPR
jgi:hypothetical protein